MDSDIIRIEFRIRWKVPVYVAVGDEPTRKISGPQDALQYLSDNRAIQTGFPYWRARHRCYDALKGLITSEEMRDDFIAACAQADFRLR
ncbi:MULTISPECIES: DUF982 domain-containing protein [Rhizobium]|uniref:DUF982 domain-containing protein n=1 Tax=Rhizobium terrae TaxID=2171756 RepID=UPI0013AF0D18|nr:DUF982 domain-containing protein [Rhizobium terrae]